MKKNVIIILALILCVAAIAAVCLQLRKPDEPAQVTAVSQTDAETEEETEAALSTEAPDDDTAFTAWKEAYHYVLTECIGEDAEFPGFGLIYLNDDDIPELVISMGTYHFANCQLYTFSDGKAVYLGNYGSWGEFVYYEREGILCEGTTQMGLTNSYIYKMKGAKMEKVYECSDDAGWVGEDSATYRVNGEEVDKATYEESRIQYQGKEENMKSTEATYKPLQHVVDEVFLGKKISGDELM